MYLHKMSSKRISLLHTIEISILNEKSWDRVKEMQYIKQ